jgi:cbb3-type cytochrome oxidase cytochrome c subunit
MLQMDVLISFLDSLKEKISIIIKKNETQDIKIKQYENEILSLKNIVINLENKIEETKKENLTLKMNQKLENQNDTSELKKKINEMVREVDKTIAYLNK